MSFPLPCLLPLNPNPNLTLTPTPTPTPTPAPVPLGSAFTLVELLVVISIIGVLAGLSVGLGGLAGRKSKEARIKAEMTKLIGGIENYKSNLGFYPPDTAGVPLPNQLYYELSGTIFTNNQFVVPGQSESLSTAVLPGLFGCSGFANSARDAKDLKSVESFKASQYQRIIYKNTPINVLAVPVKGPAYRSFPSAVSASVTVNPWSYVSTSPTNNAERFDLWVEAVIGGKTMRFSNWETDPTVVQ